jgi:hypothetical protein
MSSDPTWIDNDSFSYELDSTHIGAYSTITKRGFALPEPTRRSYVATLRHVVRGQVLVTAAVAPAETEIVGFGWPTLAEQVRFRLPSNVLDVETRDRRKYVCATAGYRPSPPIIVFDRASGGAIWGGFVRDQLIRYPRFLDPGLSFVSIAFANVVKVRNRDGEWINIPSDGEILEAARCGDEVVVTRTTEAGFAIKRISPESGQGRRIALGFAVHPTCSADGRRLYYIGGMTGQSLHRCDADECRPILEGHSLYGVAVSPSGERLALVVTGRRGPWVQWMRAEGGDLHDISETETACTPAWASERAVWISRRQGRSFAWVETDADSGRPTGRIMPGSRECSDGAQDPDSPANQDVRLVVGRRSQIRLLPKELLNTANSF